MRIAFDGTTLRPGRTGVGYYSEHLLHHLAALTPAPDLLVLSNRPLDLTRSLPQAVRVMNGRWRLPRLIWMHTLAPRLLRQLQPDVVHFTNGMMPLDCPAPTVVTIHDMSLTLLPRFHPPRRLLFNRPLLDVAARRADAIITVSESAKRDIVRHYGFDERRVHVIREAAAPQFRPVSDAGWLEAVRRRYGLADRFVLYVGTIEPRKNLRTLLEGFARRYHGGDLPHQLVFVGPYGWLCGDIEALVERLGLAGHVRFTGYVPFEELPAIYTLAEMFIFPSVYEGFGLPVIEAMACGTPVITGPTAALMEVGGDAVEQLERLDAEAVGEALVRLGRSRDRRRELALRGHARAARFSWARAAEETLSVYRRVTGRLGSPRPAEHAGAALNDATAEALAGVPRPGVGVGEAARTYRP